MKQVNIWFVMSLLDPLVGGADDDEETVRYYDVDPDDEAGMRTIIRDRLKPHFERFDARSKQMTKRSFKYFLSKPETDFEGIYDGCLPPIRTPSDPRLFFVWLWEELFGDEPFLVNLKEYQENNDIHAPNAIRLLPADGADY